MPRMILARRSPSCYNEESSPETRVADEETAFADACALLSADVLLAEHSIAANYIYQMILKQVDGTDFTRYDDDYEVMFFYPLSKHTYGDAVVRITAYEDGCTINVSYELPLDEAMMPDVLTFFNYLNNSLYVGKMMLLDIDGDWYPAYEVFMSINPEDIDAWDRGCVMDYTFNAFTSCKR